MRELDGRPATADELQALALVNYGHFTSLRVEAGRVRGLTLHLERLVRDCGIVLDAELDPDHVHELIRHAVGSDRGTFVVRVTVYDPALEMGHPGSAATPHILVTTRPAASTELPPLRVQARTFQRELPQVKHIGLFGQLNERRHAQRAGYDDALFTDPDGTISEGVTWNVGFLTAGGNVVWPEADVLPGVTMALIQRAADHTTAPVTLGSLADMQAAFACNTSIGVRPLSCIGTTGFPTDHPGLKELQAAFLADLGELL